MTALRWVSATLLGWIGLVVLLVFGLAGLATLVEAAGAGLSGAFRRGLEAAPALVVPLAPMLAGLGVALGAARMEARGERTALQAVGLGPLHTAPAAIFAGLVLGGLSLVAADRLVPAISAPPMEQWVWLDGVAVRASDGAVVRVDGGRITEVHHRPVDPAKLERARRLAEPRTASGAVLSGGELPPARVERHSRRARALACGLVALLAWLPVARATTVQLGLVGIGAMGWTGLDLSLQSAAAQGRLPPVAGGWGAFALAAIGALALLVRSRGRAPRTPRRGASPNPPR